MRVFGVKKSVWGESRAGGRWRGWGKRDSVCGVRVEQESVYRVRVGRERESVG